MSGFRQCAPRSGVYYGEPCCRVRFLRNVPEHHRRAWMERWRAKLSAEAYASTLQAVRESFPRG